MDEKEERPLIHVEGSDDQYALINLLKRNGVVYAPGDVENSPIELPKFNAVGAVEELVEGIEAAVSLNVEGIVGFVLDADAPFLDRWRSVRHQLAMVGVDAPVDRPPSEGFIGDSSEYKTKVGVWLMPDNERDGELEDFLRTLIKDDDKLYEFAQSSTDQAKNLGATFPPSDRNKAVIRAWLAWQKVPGKPYGQAMAARYFQHNSATADRFVAWFKRLYGLD